MNPSSSPSLNSILYCHLRLACKLNFSDYKLLAEWLGAYTYILPDARVTIQGIIPAISAYLDSDLSTLFNLAFHIETNFNSIQQKEILQWILDSEAYHIHHYSPCIHAPENTNCID